MKKLKNISLFKVILLSILAYSINNIYFYIFIAIYLFLDKKINALFLISIICLLFIINKFRSDFIPIGIIENVSDKYCIVDKILYKVKLINNDELKIGDILYFDNKFKVNSYTNELKKNILFYGFDYKYITNFKPRLFIYTLVNNFTDITKTALLKFIYNINNYDDIDFNLGYGFSIYYLFKYIFNKNKYVSIVFILIYGLLFTFSIKFYLLIIDFVLSFFEISKLNKFSLKILIIYVLNKYLFSNYSILIPLIISLYYLFNTSFNFRCYFAIVQSLLFGEINLLSSYLYNYYIKIQVIIICLSFIVILIPSLEPFYLYIISAYSKINSLNLSIRGSLSFISISLLIYIIKAFNIHKTYIVYILIIILLISPINHPFAHISFIDVGQGDATFIKAGLSNKCILIDTGSKYNYYKLKTYLYKQGIYKIDYLIITHNDSDHNGNIDNLNKDFKIGEIVSDGRDLSINKIKLSYFDLGQYDNDNDNSLVYATSINNLSFLFVGDISSSVEKAFISKYGTTHFDVLKVSHHGSDSASSSYFIGNILPRFAVISTSGQYGHPATSTINNLNSYLVDIFNTKVEKNVEFYFTGIVNVIKYGLLNFDIIS